MSEFSKRVIRNEPGVTEIHVEAREVLQDGPVRVECWWSDEDGAYFAQLHDAEESTRPFTATHLAHGDTREQALAHLAIGEYVTALAIAHPPAARGVTEITDAMVEACIQYELSTYTRPTFAPIVLEQAREFYRNILTAALSAPSEAAVGVSEGMVEADAWGIAAKETEQWNRLVRRCGPYLQAHMSPDEFAEMVLAYGASCSRAALSHRRGDD